MTIEYRFFRNRDTHTDFRVMIVRYRALRRWRAMVLAASRACGLPSDGGHHA